MKTSKSRNFQNEPMNSLEAEIAITALRTMEAKGTFLKGKVEGSSLQNSNLRFGDLTPDDTPESERESQRNDGRSKTR